MQSSGPFNILNVSLVSLLLKWEVSLTDLHTSQERFFPPHGLDLPQKFDYQFHKHFFSIAYFLNSLFYKFFCNFKVLGSIFSLFISNRKYIKSTWFWPHVFLLFFARKNDVNPAGIYLVKVSNRNTRTRCEICWKLTIKSMALLWCLYF